MGTKRVEQLEVTREKLKKRLGLFKFEQAGPVGRLVQTARTRLERVERRINKRLSSTG